MGYLLRKIANGKMKQPKIKKYIVINRAEKSRTNEEILDIRHGDAECVVCPVIFIISLVQYYIYSLDDISSLLEQYKYIVSM